MVSYPCCTSFVPRIKAGSHERRTKHRFNTVGANQDESGSSHPNMVSGRELRPRERKRAADIVEDSDNTSSDDDDDDVEDEPYRIEQRHGKAQAYENSSEEEEAAGEDDEDNEESDGSEQNITFPII